MSTDTPMPACPFCDIVPSFTGDAQERDDRRYYVYSLDCGCYNMEVFAGTFRDFGPHIAEKEWRKQEG